MANRVLCLVVGARHPAACAANRRRESRLVHLGLVDNWAEIGVGLQKEGLPGAHYRVSHGFWSGGSHETV